LTENELKAKFKIEQIRRKKTSTKTHGIKASQKKTTLVQATVSGPCWYTASLSAGKTCMNARNWHDLCGA
jgi:hypothetical protein